MYPLTSFGKVNFFYNCVSFTLWFCCFVRLLILLPLVGRKFVPGGISDFFHVVSVFPMLGVLLNQGSIFASEKPVTARLWPLFNAVRMIWLCYGVIFPHPKVAKHTTYSVLISSWCIANIINSAYYAFRVKTRTSPHFLFWLKFHHFYLTLPVAFIAEFSLIFLSLIFVEEGFWYETVLKFVLCSYIPVGYFFWGYLEERKSHKYNDFMNKKTLGRTTNQEETAAK